MNALKTTLTNAPVLAYYDPNKRPKISTDASKDGLGAVLLQAEGDSWKSAAYASRFMTETEKRYAQIEKECLGLVYGLQIFHCYVYGLPTFTVMIIYIYSAGRCAITSARDEHCKLH